MHLSIRDVQEAEVSAVHSLVIEMKIPPMRCALDCERLRCESPGGADAMPHYCLNNGSSFDFIGI